MRLLEEARPQPTGRAQIFPPRRDSPLASRIAWNAIASGIASAGRFLTTMLVARMLDSAQMGRFAVATWAVETVILGLSLGIPNAVSRYLAESHGRGALATIASIRTYVAWWLTLSTVGGGTLAFLLGMVWVFEGLGWPISLALALVLCSQLWVGIVQAVLAGLQRFRSLAVTNLAGAVSSIVALGLGSAFWGLDGAVSGIVVGFVVSVGLGLYQARDVSWPRVRIRWKWAHSDQEFWSYAMNAWGAALISAVVWGRTELFFIERITGDVQAAYFGIGLVFSSLVVQMLQLFTGGLMPHFASCIGRSDSEGLRRDYRRLTVLAAAVALPVSALSAALMPELVLLLFGSAYSEAAAAGTWLAACGLWGFATVGSAAVYGMGDAALVRRWSVVGAVLLFVGCWILVPPFGAAGAAAVRWAVQGSMVMAGALILRYRYGLPVPLMQLGKLFLVMIVAAGLARAVATAIGSPWLGVTGGLAVGALLYLAGIRALKVIDPELGEALFSVVSRIPGPVGRALDTIATLLVARSQG